MNSLAPVSVIVPVRNAAAHVATALESVRAQSPRPAEILVIDGGSTDGTLEIAERYPDVRLIHQQGRGLAAARNQAIQKSRSPWIAFCDGDDRWAENALTLRLQAFESNPHALAVIGRVILEAIGSATATAAQRSRIGQPVPGFTPGALLARREAFEKIGVFDESLAIGTDSDWFVRLQQSAYPVVQIEQVVLWKGARGTSLSSDVAAYRRELLTVARRFIERNRGTHQP